jgi:hypothetical protein
MSVPENIALGAWASMSSTVLPTNQHRGPQIGRALVARLDRSATDLAWGSVVLRSGLFTRVTNDPARSNTSDNEDKHRK